MIPVTVVAKEYLSDNRTCTLAEDGTVTTEGHTPAFQTALKEAFLPAGWPDSVTTDYLGFQVWDTVQGLSTYVRGMLTTHALLMGVGVGKETATPLAAAIQFFLRDFVAMAGGVIFAAVKGASLDGLAKQWRLTADVANDLALTLELEAPLYASLFLPLVCLAALCRAITGVSGSATRFALTQHFALQRNAADVAAKEGSQETAVTLIGMVFGMALTKLASVNQPAAWATFWMLTVLHLWANWKALRCLKLTRFNRPRLNVVLNQYIQTGKVFTPEELSSRESLMPPPIALVLEILRIRSPEPSISIAPNLAQLNKSDRNIIAQKIRLYAMDDFTKFVPLTVQTPGQPRRSVVVLHTSATSIDILQAYCDAYVSITNIEATKPARRRSTSRTRSSKVEHHLSQQQWTENEFNKFATKAKAAGWHIDSVALLQGASRVEWHRYSSSKTAKTKDR